MRFSTVAFDLDGTLYPEISLNARLVPFLLKEQRLLRAMGKARNQLRAYLAGSGENLAAGEIISAGGITAAAPEDTGPGEDGGVFWSDFYQIQAELMGEILGRPADETREKTERLIYRGWEPLFKKIKLFPHALAALKTFRKKGIKLGLLSDFPPETKLKNLKIDGYWDTVLCSETTGRLKPDPLPFLELARKMGTPPEEILYVGNSVSYDAEGARKAGMKAALVSPRWKKYLPVPSRKRAPAPDVFIFFDYRQLCDYVLN